MRSCERARQVATQAHSEQVDKAGNPYIAHPARVAARLSDADDDTQAVAWLHDVVEDTTVSFEELSRDGFSASVVAAVDALTKRDGESLEEYCARVRADPIALVVKQADLADNTDSARLSQLDVSTQLRLRAKYAHVFLLLGL